MVLGICGAQGSGKSTLARAVEEAACAKGIPAATLSLDDLYLTRAERDELARSVHPLLRTRGVPGTHDVGIGLAVLDALGCGEAVRLPRFDKASDDRFPPSRWSRAPEGNQLLIMEGWCLGARPQDRDALREPINVLEGQDDPEGIWRRYANDALAGVYQTLFARIDVLVLLAAPSFDVVFDWRLQQEQELRERVGPDAPGLMSATGVARFVEHYERLTRHILAEMPPRADILVSLAEDRSPLEIRVSAASR
ncbi:kinase [Novosphingobium sp. G106]|uniref:kinase n=1 Tax=Novosphingobium sp. G106 TaxID=2849500 RepID=UPI0020C20BA0|nr:kinase [Novosphingobium sp. G106]